jgi:hypothetical protein
MSLFKTWMDRMGFNGKEVSVAGEAIGVGYDTVRKRLINSDNASLTERLAMSALRAGLEPWSEDYDEGELARVRKVLEAVREAA